MDTERFLDENVKPATGCTEPVALGYATSIAYNSLFDNLPNEPCKEIPGPKTDDIETIRLSIGKGVYKNAFSMAVPGTDKEKGIYMAAAIGIFLDPNKELELFEDVDEGIIREAKKIVKENKIDITEVKDKSEFDISVCLKYEHDKVKRTSSVRLKKFHDHISTIEVDGDILYNDEHIEKESSPIEIPDNLEEMVQIAENIDENTVERLYKGIKMNKSLGEKSLKKGYGIEVGKKLDDMVKDGELSNDLVNKVKIKTAAAADARMGGIEEPVMSTSGSGNQGITVLVPIGVVGEEKKLNERKQAEAAMLAHLVTKYSTHKSSHLSALCGCSVKAGMGSAAALTYLLGGDVSKIRNSIKILAGNLTGMICDGAKEGCALKISTAAGETLESALMALKGMEVPNDNGIVGESAEETLENIGKISDEMASIDLEIIDILEKKE